MSAGRAVGAGEPVGEDAAAQVLAEGVLDVIGGVRGEILVMAGGGEIGLEVFANRAVQEGGCRSAWAIDRRAGARRCCQCGGLEHGRSRWRDGRGRRWSRVTLAVAVGCRSVDSASAVGDNWPGTAHVGGIDANPGPWIHNALPVV